MQYNTCLTYFLNQYTTDLTYCRTEWVSSLFPNRPEPSRSADRLDSVSPRLVSFSVETRELAGVGLFGEQQRARRPLRRERPAVVCPVSRRVVLSSVCPLSQNLTSVVQGAAHLTFSRNVGEM